MEKALNQQIVLNGEGRYGFYLDQEITHEYQAKSFPDFLQLYFKTSGHNGYILKDLIISKDQWNTIFYYLFVHNYLSSYDDITGNYFAFNTSNFFKSPLDKKVDSQEADSIQVLKNNKD